MERRKSLAGDEDGADDVGGDQAGVQSVETGIDLLIVLARLTADSPLQMLKAIADAAGIPAAKVHRYLVSFKRSGMVEQDAETGRYRLGPSARLIGAAAIRGTQIVRVASRQLPNLSKKTGYSSALAVWTASGPTIVWVEDASRPIAVTTRVGEVLPLLTSATGRAFASWMPDARIRPHVATELAKSAGSSAKKMQAAQATVDALCSKIREAGVSWTVGEVNIEISALAAPIFDYRGDLAGVIAVLGASGSFDVRPHGPLAGDLRQTAQQISEELGYLKVAETD